MVCLVRQDGTVSRNQKEILKMQACFYQKLYHSDVNVDFIFTEFQGE